jgi:hypothetical protein
VKLIVVRDGSAILAGDFGRKPITAGDVVLLGANVACGSEPESHIALTVIYVDMDYLLDQIFWSTRTCCMIGLTPANLPPSSSANGLKLCGWALTK